MGCGAICGDPNTSAHTPTALAIRAMHTQLPLLRTTNALMPQTTLSAFLAHYPTDPKPYHLESKSGLGPWEPLKSQVLTRWKVLSFGCEQSLDLYVSCLGVPGEQQSAEVGDLSLELGAGHSTLLPHDCFSQIEKDLHRTFQLQEESRRSFQRVLKRIANYFPKVGYTQGMNFVVAFLLLAGFSEQQAFWMFVHAALSPRCLLLGLYEDGFPLNYLCCHLFARLLQRHRPQLHQHLFEDLSIDVSMWVFKWFMTCFVYSMPLELGKHAWDVLLQLGSLGLVSLAVSLALELQPYLLTKEDLPELSEFLKSLEKAEVFNHYVNLSSLLTRTYQIEITPLDFDGGSEKVFGFYASYFRSNCQSLQRHLSKDAGLPTAAQVAHKQTSLLEQWYQQLIDQRSQFVKNTRSGSIWDGLPLASGLPLQSVQKGRNDSFEDLELVLLNKDEESTAEGKGKAGQLRQSHTNWKNSRLPFPIERINENVDEESQSISISHLPSQKSIGRQSQRSKGRQSQHSGARHSRQSSHPPDQQDELDRLEKAFGEKEMGIRANRRNNQFKKAGKEGKKGVKEIKINNYALPKKEEKAESEQNSSNRGKPGRNAGNIFALAGQNAISIDNYDLVSVSSRNASAHNRSIVAVPAETKGSRNCTPCKIKTEENRLSNMDRSSEMASSKDQFSDKESLSNHHFSHSDEHNEEPINTIQQIETHRERVQTQEHSMAASHGPTLRQNSATTNVEATINREAENQVEVLAPFEPFKKGKKFKEGRVSIQ